MTPQTISNKVRYYHAGMAGAPELSGIAGALIAVLDACLVNGFGTKTINTLTVTDGVAVAQISSGHDFGEGDVLRVAGATPAGLNSDWRIASATADTVTWSVEGLGIAAGSATGIITCLRAPAGWEKVFADGTTRAAYRSLDHAAHNGLFLYVDDTGATTTRVRGFESMTDIDTGIAPFPTDAQRSGGGYWGKASNTTGARNWTLVADQRRLLYCPRPANQTAKSFGFGLLFDAAGSDLWATILSSAVSGTENAVNSGNASWGDMAYESAGHLVGAYIARTMGGTASGECYLAQPSLVNTVTGDASFATGVLPQDIPPLAHVMIVEAGRRGRGFFPGPCFANRRFLNTDTPPGTRVGVPGHGAQLEFAGSYSLQYAWFIHLGQNGKWD